MDFFTLMQFWKILWLGLEASSNEFANPIKALVKKAKLEELLRN